MKKILLTGVGANMGGTETFVQTLVKELHHNANFVVLAASKTEVAEADFFKKYNVRVVYLKNIFGFKSILKRPRIIESFLLKEKFDIVHINATSLNAAYIAKKADKLGVKVIYQVHNYSPSGYGVVAKSLTTLLAKNNRSILKKIPDIKLVAVSEEVQEKLFGRKIKSEVILNGVDSDVYAFNESRRRIIREKFLISEKEVVGIMVARMTPIKNYDRAVKIATLSIERGVLDRFYMVGDGPERERIQKLIDELPSRIKENMYVMGERNDIPDLLTMSDVMLLTSSNEGLSLSVIEGQAAGLGIVASDGVPPVTNITGKVIYISLRVEDKIWTDAIEKVSINNFTDRIKSNEYVLNSQFSKKIFIRKFIELYNL
ncbi:glycosyltransferase [Pediococcus pentosaceus]